MDIAQAGVYCGADVDATIHVFLLAPSLRPNYTLRICGRFIMKLSGQLLPVLTDMEMAGVLLDTEFLAKMSVELTARLTRTRG